MAVLQSQTQKIILTPPKSMLYPQSAPALTPDFPPCHSKLSPGTTMPYHRQTSGTHLRSNRPLASVLQSRKIQKSASTTKNFVTKPEKSPCLAANPHRISKRLREKPEFLRFDILKSQVRWPFSQVRRTQNRPDEPNRTRPGSTQKPRLFPHPAPRNRHIFSKLPCKPTEHGPAISEAVFRSKPL